MKCSLVVILLAAGGCASPNAYERHIRAEALAYDQRPDYIAQRARIRLPKNYSVENKLRLIAHGFDPHVRLVLAGQLADDMDHDDTLRRKVLAFMESKDPDLAWASAWVCEKCVEGGPDATPTYRRPDVMQFEQMYHQ
jgi:hypothetical protein